MVTGNWEGLTQKNSMKSKTDNLSSSNLAVIILNFFKYKDTFRCIDEVLHSLNATFFIVDNSAENNEKKNLELKRADQSHIHLIFPEENLGFAVGVNIALEKAVEAGFSRFLLLNNDVVLPKNFGNLLIKAFIERPAALIAPVIKNDTHGYCESYYHNYLGVITKRNISQKPKPLYEKIGWVPYLSGCALAFDKNVLDEIGYLDGSFFMYGEDVVFSYRALKSNIPLVVLEDERVYHHGSRSAKMASFFYEYHMARAHFLMSFKLVSNPCLRLISLFGKCAALWIRAYIRCFRYRTAAPLAALLLCPLPIKVRPLRPEKPYA